MFFLLATFMMVSLSMVKNHGISVSLASSETSEAVRQDDRTVVVSVDKSGRYYLDKNTVSRGQLETALAKVRRNSRKQTVVVNADKSASHGQVITLLDIVRKSGVGQAVFAVDAENTAS